MKRRNLMLAMVAAPFSRMRRKKVEPVTFAKFVPGGYSLTFTFYVGGKSVGRIHVHADTPREVVRARLTAALNRGWSVGAGKAGTFC